MKITLVNDEGQEFEQEITGTLRFTRDAGTGEVELREDEGGSFSVSRLQFEEQAIVEVRVTA